jgi:hypothetical protein
VIEGEVFDHLLKLVAMLSEFASKLVLKSCAVVETELLARELVNGRSRIAGTMKPEKNFEQQIIRHFIPLGRVW